MMNSLCAAAGLEKIVTEPLACLYTPVFGLEPTNWARPVYCQSVGQFWPTSTLKGKPEVQRATPVNCHPAINPLATEPELAPKRLPLPNGRSHNQLPLS